jgi:ABC-type methionine transport system ATPase subunit
MFRWSESKAFYARALLINPDINFDVCFSALDFKTAAKLLRI